MHFQDKPYFINVLVGYNEPNIVWKIQYYLVVCSI
jgi:hypothetical protein